MNFRSEGAVHRTLVGDFHQSLALIGVERALHRNYTVELIEHAGLGFAFGAVFRVDPAVAQRHRHPVKRQQFAIGIHPHRNRGAGAEPGQHIVIRPRAAIRAADRDRLVGEQMMRPDDDVVLVFAVAGFAHHDIARRSIGYSRGLLRRGRIEITYDPGSDQNGDINSVTLPAQKMIAIRQRYETLGMFGRDENPRRIVDADGVVGRRVHDQQRLVQLGDVRHQIVLGDVVEKFALDVERPARERDLDLTLRADILDAVLEKMRDMGGIGWRRDGDDRPGVMDSLRGGQDRRAAEAVADQDRRALAGLSQVIGSQHQIVDVRRERRVGKIAPAGAEPGEVEAQHANAFFRQLTRDAAGRQPVLAAGEAMREQCVGDRFAVWQIERRRQLVTVGSRNESVQSACRLSLIG